MTIQIHAVNSDGTHKLNVMRMRLSSITGEKMERYIDPNKALREVPAYRNLTTFMTREAPRWRDKKTGGRRIKHENIAACWNKEPSHFRSGEALCNFRRDVAPGLVVDGHSVRERRTRVILDDGLGEAGRNMLREIELKKQERVTVHDKKPQSERKVYDAERPMHKIANEQIWPYPELQKPIVDYLNDRPMSFYMELLGEHGDELALVANEFDFDAYMHNLRDFPKPLYMPVDKPESRTIRIYGTGPAYMPKQLRRVFFRGMPELDGKNMHLAIFEMLYRHLMPRTGEFLETGSSIWKLIADDLRIPDAQREEAKPFTKTALYSVEYGKYINFAASQLYTDLKDHDIRFQKKWGNNFVVSELAAAVKQALSEIEESGYVDTPLGTPHDRWHLRPGEDPESLLASVIQAYEFMLIKPCYDLLFDDMRHSHTKFDIVLHQHDGFTIAPRGNADLAKQIGRLQKAFASTAAVMGVTTSLVCS